MRTVDELNNITFDEKEFFREYFKSMDIPEEAKKEREEAASDIMAVLLLIFILLEDNIERNALSYDEILYQFQIEFADVIAKYGRNDAYFSEYLNVATTDILRTTYDHIGEEYYFSQERLAIVSANESNNILNYEELQRALEKGYTHKTWKAEIDRKTREDHLEMDGTTIPIEDYFILPDCEMAMPHDEVNGTARQCANCRCSLHYTNEK